MFLVARHTMCVFPITKNLNFCFSFFAGKVEPHSSFNMGYLVAPYSYTNGAAGGLPVSMVS